MPDVPLTEASVLLGVRAEALRKRLQRGTVSGYKDDQGEWIVSLPDSRVTPPNGAPALDPAPPAPEPPPIAALADVPAGGQAGGHVQDSLPNGAAEPALLRELVAHQRELLDELREELAARRREVQQLHTLLAQAQQRALPVPESWESDAGDGSVVAPPPREPAPAGGSAPLRPWWRFWS